MLNQAQSICDYLNLVEIVCVFDQAIYEKAVDILWTEGGKFQKIIPRMGEFHTCMNLLGTIGKRFEDAGLRDLALESGIVAEGSVNTVMSGKAYNRAVRFHKLMYESYCELPGKGFQLG